MDFLQWRLRSFYGDVKVVGIDISPSIIRRARRNIRRWNLQGNIEVMEMDATSMQFPKEEFDMVVDFTGLEDVQMTRGLIGIQQALFEVKRVLKSNCHFCITEMLSDEMKTEPEKLEMSVFSYICGRKALTAKIIGQ